MAQITEDVRSISRLFGDALDTLVKLIQTEIRLAKAEVGQKARQAATGMGMLFGAMLLVIPALVLLLIALAVWLAQLGVPPAAAYALSGVLALAGAGVLTFFGVAALSPAALAPRATIDEVRQDIAAAKEVAS